MKITGNKKELIEVSIPTKALYGNNFFNLDDDLELKLKDRKIKLIVKKFELFTQTDGIEPGGRIELSMRGELKAIKRLRVKKLRKLAKA